MIETECLCEEWNESWECHGDGLHKCSDCNDWLPKGHFLFDECDLCEDEDYVDEPKGFVTKDSGVRAEYDSGMVRDTQDGKPRFDLLLPEGVPYSDQFFTRVAELLARGAEKYSDRNWEKASGQEELDRFKASAFRHFQQWITGEVDEDHAAAVVFNLLAFETIQWKLKNA